MDFAAPDDWDPVQRQSRQFYRTRTESAGLIVADLVQQGIRESELRNAIDARTKNRSLGVDPVTTGQRPGRVVPIAAEYRPGAPVDLEPRTRPQNRMRALMSWVEIDRQPGWEVDR